MSDIFQTQCPPILIIIFNRPDLTKRVFERIREAQPSKLFIAADGPRSDHFNDILLCAETKAVVDQVDWDCKVHTLFRDQNLGCKVAVSSAITWFFEHVEEGVILEDDCVPHTTFFRFCAELLDYYRDDKRIMLISGNNFQQGQHRTPYSYYFSRYHHIWGWASWRRAWQYYDGDMKHWPALRDTPWLQDIHISEAAANYWRVIFEKSYAGEVDSWDYPWLYSCWEQNSLAISPETNLVSNIGFDERATHTKSAESKVTNLPVMAMQFPLRHSPFVVRHLIADQFTFETIFLHFPETPLSFFKRVVHKIKNSIRNELIKTGIKK